MRAIAVLAVVVYHVWPSRLTGGFIGVDVFFVISGFVITSGLCRRPPRSFGDLRDFWTRRILRLLPASLLVVVCTIVGVIAVAPDSQWSPHARAAISSVLYFENWHLAADAVDYLRSDDPPTAFQQFWSLSVEEQFYLFWPILFLLVTGAALIMRRSRALIAITVVTVLVLSSFVVSLRLTAVAPSTAYLSTPARTWEFGLGGLLAIIVAARPDGRLHGDRLLSVVSSCGLVAIVSAALLFSDSTAFPGWPATVPVVGCAAVIAGGCTNRPNTPGRLLGTRPLLFLGGISYSLYLWHWPLIVLLPSVSGGSLGALDRAAIVVAATVLAALTKQFVEDPFRRGDRPRVGARPFRFAAAGMLVAVAVSVGLLNEVDQRRAEARRELSDVAEAGGPCFGAAALAHDSDTCPPVPRDQIVPAVAEAAEDRTSAYADECWAYPPFVDMTSCFYGEIDASRSVALVGNSHAGHWLSTLQELMDEEDFSVTTFMASGCNVTTTRVNWDPAEHGAACLEWAERVAREVASGRYDLVVTSAIQTRSPLESQNAEEAHEMARSGYADVLATWASFGVDVLVIRDTPQAIAAIGPIPDCVAINADAATSCSGSRNDWLQPDPLFDAANDLSDHVSSIDLTRYFCSVDTCFGVIGGVIAFYDQHHMTDTFARTLAPFLREALSNSLDRA